jgi:hypothetical protein
VHYEWPRDKKYNNATQMYCATTSCQQEWRQRIRNEMHNEKRRDAKHDIASKKHGSATKMKCTTKNDATRRTAVQPKAIALRSGATRGTAMQP